MNDSGSPFVLRVQSWSKQGEQVQAYDRVQISFEQMVDIALRFVANEDGLITQAFIFRMIPHPLPNHPVIWKPIWRIRSSEDQNHDYFTN